MSVAWAGSGAAHGCPSQQARSGSRLAPSPPHSLPLHPFSLSPSLAAGSAGPALDGDICGTNLWVAWPGRGGDPGDAVPPLPLPLSPPPCRRATPSLCIRLPDATNRDLQPPARPAPPLPVPPPCVVRDLSQPSGKVRVVLAGPRRPGLPVAIGRSGQPRLASVVELLPSGT